MSLDEKNSHPTIDYNDSLQKRKKRILISIFVLTSEKGKTGLFLRL